MSLSIITNVRCPSNDMKSTNVFKQQLPGDSAIHSIDPPSRFVFFFLLDLRIRALISLIHFQKMNSYEKAISCERKEERESQ